MRLRFLVPLALICALAVAQSAYAFPHLPAKQSKMVASLVDRWTKDLVLGRNLADGWTISGPQERGVTTRKEWIAGRLPIQRLRLIGTSWTHAWTATYATPNEYGLDVNWRVGRHEMWDEEMVLQRIRGKWVVNAVYTSDVTHLGPDHHHSCVSPKCLINDFKPGGVVTPKSQARLGSGWLGVAIGGILAFPLAGLLAYFFYAYSRNRRAWVDYASTRRA